MWYNCGSKGTLRQLGSRRLRTLRVENSGLHEKVYSCVKFSYPDLHSCVCTLSVSLYASLADRCQPAYRVGSSVSLFLGGKPEPTSRRKPLDLSMGLLT